MEGGVLGGWRVVACWCSCCALALRSTVQRSEVGTLDVKYTRRGYQIAQNFKYTKIHVFSGCVGANVGVKYACSVSDTLTVSARAPPRMQCPSDTGDSVRQAHCKQFRKYFQKYSIILLESISRNASFHERKNTSRAREGTRAAPCWKKRSATCRDM